MKNALRGLSSPPPPGPSGPANRRLVKRTVVVPSTFAALRTVGKRENPRKTCASGARAACRAASVQGLGTWTVSRQGASPVAGLRRRRGSRHVQVAHVVPVRHARHHAPVERREEIGKGRDLDQTARCALHGTDVSTGGRGDAGPPRDRRERIHRTARRRHQRAERAGRERQGARVRRGTHAVVGRHQNQDDRRTPSPRGVRSAAEHQARRQHHQQEDVNDRHPVRGVPGPAERAEHPRAVRGRQVHQDVAQDAQNRHRREGAESRLPGCAASDGALAAPDETRHQEAESDDAEQSVRGPAVPPEVSSAPPAAVTTSTSGAFDARTSAAVAPRPALASGVRASVSANRLCVRLSMRQRAAPSVRPIGRLLR